MQDLKNIKKEIYDSLIESGVPQKDAIAAVSSAMKEIRNKIYPSHAEYMQKIIEKEFANKTFFEILKQQSENSGIPFDLRNEKDVFALDGNTSDYERDMASKCFKTVRYSEFDCAYKAKNNRCVDSEFQFLIYQYFKSKQQHNLDEAIEHSSREVFILMYLYQVMNARVEDIDNLRNLANDFQIGTKIGDKIILRLAMRFVIGIEQLVQLMNSLDLILDCKDIFGERTWI